jgi:hypothetical protein
MTTPARPAPAKTQPAAPGRLAAFAGSLVVRVIAYYVILFAGAAAVTRLIPGALPFLNARLPAGTLTDVRIASMGEDPATVIISALVAAASACLLMLPVTWVYAHTRRKKGFQQSVVQTLIILPLVVAGVILLVQNSAALAFSLGGIVGAVSFRNSLRDTKDAIYIFLAIVVGLAAGVHSMLIAATISASFNAVALLMWWADFGRTGATLEGAPAQRRLRRAKALANRTGAFISLIDRELLQSMTPEQLDLIAGRARMHQYAGAAEAGLDSLKKGPRDRMLRVQMKGGLDGARRAAGRALDKSAKKWELLKATPLPDGGSAIEYRVRLRRSTDPADFLANFRAGAGPLIVTAELVDDARPG